MQGAVPELCVALARGPVGTSMAMARRVIRITNPPTLPLTFARGYKPHSVLLLSSPSERNVRRQPHAEQSRRRSSPQRSRSKRESIEARCPPPAPTSPATPFSALTRLRAPGRSQLLVDLDGLAATIKAGELLHLHQTSAAAPVLGLRDSVYLAVQGVGKRLWNRLRPHLAGDVWAVLSGPPCLLLVRQAAVQPIARRLKAMGIHVRPAWQCEDIGETDRWFIPFAFKKHDRGGVPLAALLAAIMTAAADEHEPGYNDLVFVQLGQLLPFYNFPLDEEGTCREAPVGHVGMHLYSWFRNHGTVYWVDIGVRVPPKLEDGVAVWQLYLYDEEAPRQVQHAGFHLPPSFYSVFEMHGLDAGWATFGIDRARRVEMADAALRAEREDVEAEMLDARRRGDDVYWRAAAEAVERGEATCAHVLNLFCDVIHVRAAMPTAAAVTRPNTHSP